MLLIKYGQPNIDLSVPFEKKWSIIQNRYYVLSMIAGLPDIVHPNSILLEIVWSS